MTTKSGSFSLLNIQPGSYKIRAAAAGFATLEKTGIILEVNRPPA